MLHLLDALQPVCYTADKKRMPTEVASFPMHFNCIAIMIQALLVASVRCTHTDLVRDTVVALIQRTRTSCQLILQVAPVQRTHTTLQYFAPSSRVVNKFLHQVPNKACGSPRTRIRQAAESRCGSCRVGNGPMVLPPSRALEGMVPWPIQEEMIACSSRYLTACARSPAICYALQP